MCWASQLLHSLYSVKSDGTQIHGVTANAGLIIFPRQEPEFRTRVSSISMNFKMLSARFREMERVAYIIFFNVYKIDLNYND